MLKYITNFGIVAHLKTMLVYKPICHQCQYIPLISGMHESHSYKKNEFLLTLNIIPHTCFVLILLKWIFLIWRCKFLVQENPLWHAGHWCWRSLWVDA